MDCLISRLQRNRDYKTFLRRAILLKGDQTVDDIFESPLWTKCKEIYFDDSLEDSKAAAQEFYQENFEEMKFPVLWEEKWDCFNDLAIPYWENRQAFMSEMMNNASEIGLRWFRSVRTQTVEEIEEHDFKKTILCIDPASTTSRKSDFTAMVVGSTATNGFKYMREIVMDKLEFNLYCAKVVEILVKYEEISYVYVEKNTFQGADIIKIKELIAKEPKLRNRKIEFANEMQRTNKEEKISTIIDDVNNGRIIFVDNNPKAIEQLMDYQGEKYSLHDDFVDCVAECSNRLEKVNTNNVISLLDRKLLW